MSNQVNKGTGAGGANTNKSGLPFEEKTCNEKNLEAKGFVKQILKKSRKTAYYLENKEKTIVFMKKKGLNYYLDKFLNKTIDKEPDEAYLLRDGDGYILKILEKKNQTVEGSVIEKLETVDFKKYHYQRCLGPTVRVEYAFCLSKFLKEKYESGKYANLRDYLKEKNVEVLFGDDKNYFTKLDEWIHSK